MNKDETRYAHALENFCDKFRDSALALKRRVELLKFEEAIQLSYPYLSTQLKVPCPSYPQFAL